MKITIFSRDSVSDVKNFKYIFAGFLCCVWGLISPSSWLFLWFLIHAVTGQGP